MITRSRTAHPRSDTRGGLRVSRVSHSRPARRAGEKGGGGRLGCAADAAVV